MSARLTRQPLAGLLVPTLAVLAAAGTARAGPEEIARVLSGYPPALAHLEQVFKQVRATGTLTQSITMLPGGGPRKTFKVQLDVDGEYRRLISRFVGKPGDPNDAAESVYCTGPETRFIVKRATADAPYALSDLGQGTMDAASLIDNYGGHYLFAPFAIHGVSMSVAMREPGFKITAAEEAREGGDRLLRFDYQRKDAAGNMMTGRVELLPDKAWVIRRHEVNMKLRPLGATQGTPLPIKVSVETEFGGDYEGIPLPRKVVSRDMTTQRVMEFDAVTPGAATPPREFALTNYGLPDVTTVGRDQSLDYRYTIYAMFGVAALVYAAAIYLRRSAARRESAR
jgi:hypothetical protein